MRRALGLGLLAGLAAGAVMVLVTLLLRMLAGVPLPTELVSDRVLPMIPVGRFLDLLAALGGPIQAKQIGYFSAFAGQLATAAALGALQGALVERRSRRPPGTSVAWWRPTARPIVTVGAVMAVLLVVLIGALWPELDANYRGLPLGPARLATIAGLTASFAIFLIALEVFHRMLTSTATPEPDGDSGSGPPIARRAFLVGGVGVVAAVSSLGAMRALYRRGTFGYDGMSLRPGDLSEVTPTPKFYSVTKNLIDPRVDAGSWRLEVTGHVEHPRSYTLADLRAMAPVHQTQTLECISNSVGGGLISNAEWTGVRLADLIAASRPREGAVQAFFHGVNGFTNEMSMERAMRPIAVIAYEMNGAPLDDRHGYPARLLAPGSYGEVSVKWITRVEIADHESEGYYGRQGWKANHVQTMSRFFGLRRNARIPAGAMTLAGVAFAGDRGISAVEVSVNGGRAWRPARIDYNPSKIAWTLWSLPWRARPGTHELVVRAVNGDGTPQSAKVQGIDPSGAAGYHRLAVTVV